jgi:hypothetical protein
MYCPHCATDNLDNASFCRGCGANISLVSQALTGNPPAANADELEDDLSDRQRRRRKKRCDKPPSVERAIKNIFMGLAFVLVAFSVRHSLGGMTWWYWMFIPAFAMIGGGLAEIARLKLEKKPELPAAATRSAAMPAAPQSPSALPARNTSELIPQPPSITEGTTRHLETPVKSKRENV